MDWTGQGKWVGGGAVQENQAEERDGESHNKINEGLTML